jgi:N-acetylglucosaminyl-diphospho-decaprenol L-rhamnosyltransferase
MMVSVIIIHHGDASLVENCIASFIRAVRKPSFEIIVVDNDAEEGALKNIRRRFPSVRMIKARRNMGFGEANNAAAKLACGKYLFFLNNDTLVHDDFLSPLVRLMENSPEIGAAGPRLLNSDGSFQLSSGMHMGLRGEAEARWLARLLRSSSDGTGKRLLQNKEPAWLTGAALMVPRALFGELGGFDAGYFMYFEDMDLCRRIGLAGRRIRYEPACSLTHFKGGSARGESGKISLEYRRSQLLFYMKHGKRAETLCIRLYLAFKYGALFLLIPGRRKCAGRILGLVLKPAPFDPA